MDQQRSILGLQKLFPDLHDICNENINLLNSSPQKPFLIEEIAIEVMRA